MSGVVRSLGFQGRMNRRQFAVHALAAILLAALLIALSISGPGSVSFLVALLWCLAVPAAMLIRAMVKRLHDRNKSGWRLLIFLLPPVLFRGLVPWFFYTVEGLNFLILVCLLLLAIITIAVFFPLLFLKGTAGPNAYGPEPQ